MFSEQNFCTNVMPHLIFPIVSEFFESVVCNMNCGFDAKGILWSVRDLIKLPFKRESKTLFFVSRLHSYDTRRWTLHESEKQSGSNSSFMSNENSANFFSKYSKSIFHGASMTLFSPEEVFGHLMVWVHKMLPDSFRRGVIHNLQTKYNFFHHKWNWTFNFNHTSIQSSKVFYV